MFLLCFVVTFLLFDIHFRSSLEIVDLQLSPPRMYLNCTAQMYKDIWFLATQNTFKNCTKLGTIYVMRQIWQSRDNMWSQCTQWVEILLKVAFYFLWTCVFTKYLCTIHVTIARLKWSLTALFNDPTRDSIANNFVIGVYCRCLLILYQIAFFYKI